LAKVLRNSRGYLIFCPACNCGHEFIEGRWTFNGDMDKPTFQPSMLVYKDDPEKRCHSFVTNGRIQFLSDCGHKMRGQTVELPEI
jgi:hypothetical protein